MKEDVLAAVQTRRPTGDHYTFIKTRSRLRNRSSSQIEIDIVGDEEIECAVSIIFEKMGRWLLALGETFQARSVHQENVEPAVVVVIVKSHAAASGLKQIFVLVLAAVDCFGVQSGFAGDIDKTYAEIGGFGRGGRLQ